MNILPAGYLFLLIIFSVQCVKRRSDPSKQTLVKFRKTVEEIDDTKTDSKSDNSVDKIVSFLVNNAKDIFEVTDDEVFSKGKNNIDEDNVFTKSTMMFRPIMSPDSIIKNEIDEQFQNCTAYMATRTSPDSVIRIKIGKQLGDFPVYKREKRATKSSENSTTSSYNEFLSLTHTHSDTFPFLVNSNLNVTITPTFTPGNLTKISQTATTPADAPQTDLPKNNIRSDKPIQDDDDDDDDGDEDDPEYNDERHSCIICNNVFSEACSYPQNKLVPSSICSTVDELCYSLHTPFGIVERGCYDINRNKSVYVCSCNLCNHLSITDMPHIFATKKDWIENVIELSRSRRLRQTVLKDMSCLSCEVTASFKSDMLNDANCLEGNVAAVETEVCKENELCGITVIKSTGYLKRGCVKKPQYNYWLTLCDNSLCNADNLASIYELQDMQVAT